MNKKLLPILLAPILIGAISYKMKESEIGTVLFFISVTTFILCGWLILTARKEELVGVKRQ